MLIGAIAPTLSGTISSAGLPFGIMAISSFLRQEGVHCKVFSTAFPNATKEIYGSLDDFDLVGISSMSGPYLNYAISVAKNIKWTRPDLPIVWGGAHASLMDEDLIKKDFVDFVIRGVGEKALLELTKTLEGQSSLESVPGLTWIKDGAIKRNNQNGEFNINEFPPLDYSLLPKQSFKDFGYFTSRGCPFNCSYCVSSLLYNRRWYSKSIDKVVTELKDVYNTYKFESVCFWDDNLFVNIKRLDTILSKLNALGIHFQWLAFGRADTFSRLDKRILIKLKEKGLKWISMGAESGSQKTLDRLNKGIKVDDIKQSTIKLKEAGIPCDFSFMGGIPGETAEDFDKTLDLLKWIKDTYPQASVRVYRFIPYPKMPILNKEISKLLPTDIYGWSKITYQDTRFPWVPKKIDRVLTILSPASLYSPKNPMTMFLYYVTQFRIKTKFFWLPLEGWAVEKVYTRLLLKKERLWKAKRKK